MTSRESSKRQAVGLAIDEYIQSIRIFKRHSPRVDDVYYFNKRNQFSFIDMVGSVMGRYYLIEMKCIQYGFGTFPIFVEDIGSFTVSVGQSTETFLMSRTGAASIAYGVYSIQENKFIFVDVALCKIYKHCHSKEFTKIGYGSDAILLEIDNFLNVDDIINIEELLKNKYGYTNIRY